MHFLSKTFHSKVYHSSDKYWCTRARFIIIMSFELDYSVEGEKSFKYKSMSCLLIFGWVENRVKSFNEIILNIIELENNWMNNFVFWYQLKSNFKIVFIFSLNPWDNQGGKERKGRMKRRRVKRVSANLVLILLRKKGKNGK